MNWYQIYASPVGELLLRSDGESLTGLCFSDQRVEPAEGEQEAKEEIPVLRQTALWLDLYFGGKKPDFFSPMKPRGTEFRRKVWELLLEIPYGETTTYGEIARKMATITGKEKMSAQAVGGAVGHNPIGIIVPCHRVIGTDGSLTGYGGGMDRKVFLLQLEGIPVSTK